MTNKISLKTILEDTLWVVKFNGGRTICKHSEIDYNNDDIRDVDIASEQPEHLKEFYTV
jgi:hypothetical protein